MAISNSAPTMAAERRRPTCRPRTKVIGTHSAFSSACTVRPIVSASHGNTNDNTAASRAIDRPSTPRAARDRPCPAAQARARSRAWTAYRYSSDVGSPARLLVVYSRLEDGYQGEPEQDQDMRRHVQSRPCGGVLRRLGMRSRQDGGPAGHQFLEGVSPGRRAPVAPMARRSPAHRRSASRRTSQPHTRAGPASRSAREPVQSWPHAPRKAPALRRRRRTRW